MASELGPSGDRRVTREVRALIVGSMVDSVPLTHKEERRGMRSGEALAGVGLSIAYIQAHSDGPDTR